MTPEERVEEISFRLLEAGCAIGVYGEHLVLQAIREAVNAEVSLLREALEYQARVNHGYSHLAQRALDGHPLSDRQREFLTYDLRRNPHAETPHPPTKKEEER